jgi:hypothetical protein
LLRAQLTPGFSTISVSLQHVDGHEMAKFTNWAQGGSERPTWARGGKDWPGADDQPLSGEASYVRNGQDGEGFRMP